ncbi:TetR family transcriptional regulator [Sphingobium sp. SCG-1]|uniref:TetR/AcrR family transcriptional regulator n=1 Tax=Sphingobium sp. SCG-1 TaxID=2072936 RepID=UPI000CD68525|nr:TetR/AcrR family transcriptional regulator [Sphingobium sp. SCG-1]AUW58574.1 TetR family transcriptional regulator [Sphingobium sp. SCG-1]
MNLGEDTGKRKVRSDAERNRERLLAAAKDVFGSGGAKASLEAVARTAGLGIGTLYRHFPSREGLYEAVYRREVDQLICLADRLVLDNDTVGSLKQWLHAAVDTIATKKGMVTAFALAADTTSDISAQMSGRMIAALDKLLANAIGSGALAAGITGEELLLALVGMFIIRDQQDWRASVIKLVDTLVEGLRR